MNQAKSNLKSLIENTNFQSYALSRFANIVEREASRRESSSFTLAKKNNRRNRYTDIIPFDNNIVKITSSPYINASWIVSGTNNYIATQGPIPSTVIDFWSMVIEHNVPAIVCLTPQYEKNMEKCAKYWPELGQELVFGPVTLTTTEQHEDIPSASVIRQISIKISNDGGVSETKTVQQLQFLGWPDHGVPTNTNAVIELIKKTREYKQNNRPVVVHCSAGCGRTGTFCVIDSAETMLRENPNFEFDPVWTLTDEFRKQRVTMVQAPAQYVFCYRALLDMLS
ncbi:receptor/non-receptor type protein-tyrosine phosphatase [Backusella circina FSU 941]|nr:receptor/non-receptor type protein-tyrosine phosphatase [Backusella circina FSU 941]